MPKLRVTAQWSPDDLPADAWKAFSEAVRDAVADAAALPESERDAFIASAVKELQDAITELLAVPNTPRS